MKQIISKEKATDIAVLLLRISAGIMFVQAGGMKLFGWFNLMPGGGTVPFLSQAWIGGVLETIGGSLIVIGLCTRPVAFILSGEMAVAYWQFHAPQAVWPIVNQGQPAVLYCFIFLLLAAYGAGKYSIDALISKRKQSAII